MSGRPTLRLPDDVLAQVPSSKNEMLEYLSRYVDSQMLAQYEEDFRRRVSGALGAPFARHEQVLLRDFSMWLLLGELKSRLEESPAKIAAAK
jgi:hypothetical protein